MGTKVYSFQKMDEVSSYLVKLKKIKQLLSPQMGSPYQEEDDDDDNNIQNFKKKTPLENSSIYTKISDTPIIDSFGTDLTKAAEEGELDPVVGREIEIERLVQILSRRKKNNPVLIGDPGVGKSAIVEGLASRIVQRKVSRVLFGKRIVNLDMVGVVAGTKYRGQFEERIKAIFNELTKNPNIILFLDEIHTIIGTGSASGTMDAANMLKPVLTKGKIQCIGATTLDEYRVIEKDGALERRFQKIIIDPPSSKETRLILEKIKQQYEEHHNVLYSEEALDMCIKLSERYIHERYFPDKAIDVMDEAGANVHISSIIVPEKIKILEDNIRKLKESKIQAIKSQNFEIAANFRDEERHLTSNLDIEQVQWDKELKKNRQIVDAEKVAEVISVMTNIPLKQMTQSEYQKLSEMENILKTRVIAQDKAIQKIVKAIQRNQIGLKNPNKPIGTFMFLGPTGVGKTYLAKKISEHLFNSTNALIRVDMSEFMEKFTVSRLVGAPPGYVGYEEGGQLTEKVRRKPYSVILLDEIEKAHTDVFNLLLQVMDEGHLTDSLGRKIDFKNTVLIMTSNIGNRQVKDFGRNIGFKTEDENEDKFRVRNVIQKALEKTFAPEFLNRVDDVILFDLLDKKSILQIVDIELEKFHKRVKNLGYQINLDDSVKKFIASKSYDFQFGARPIKRSIQKYIENELAEMIIQLKIKKGDIVNINLSSDKKRVIIIEKNIKNL